jgi:DNA-directed RNA polymerase subunit H (RpoH/RPB5)
MNNQNVLVKKTISEMMIDRGHQIIDRRDDYFLVKKTDDSEIVVFFSFFEKLNTSILKEYIKEIEKNNIIHMIIIYKDKVTSSVNKIIDNIFHLNIEIFPFSNLSFNITKHRLYRPHILLKPTEKNIFIKKYGKQIPKILLCDPIVRYFNFKTGDIVKIIRRNNFISYRIVVDE